MKTLLADLRTSLFLTLIFAVLLCGVYPLAVWAGAQTLFPAQANGSLITDAAGTVRGSALLAQSFTSPRYFHPRPSAAGTGYDATASSGTNLGPTSQKLADAIKARVAAYRTTNALSPTTPVPADAVTASASGLDPHISLANAQLQAPRIAAARNLPLPQITAALAADTHTRDLGIFGEPTVNVLQLNLALDQLH
ncbi:MAG: K(+)-transporting ATPase subunit C [Undibacterium sp.]|nr:K(+)-transporting ATPase subunit C [Opitutaceae bacterium]